MTMYDECARACARVRVCACARGFMVMACGQGEGTVTICANNGLYVNGTSQFSTIYLHNAVVVFRRHPSHRYSYLYCQVFVDGAQYDSQKSSRRHRRREQARINSNSVHTIKQHQCNDGRTVPTCLAHSFAHRPPSAEGHGQDAGTTVRTGGRQRDDGRPAGNLGVQRELARFHDVDVGVQGRPGHQRGAF